MCNVSINTPFTDVTPINLTVAVCPIYFLFIVCLSVYIALARCVRVIVPSPGHEVSESSFPFRSTLPRVYHEPIPPHRMIKE